MTATSRALVLALLCLLWSPAGFGQGNSIASYAPTVGSSCPNESSSSANSNALIRTFTPASQSLNPQEQAYISARESSVVPGAWSDWLGDGSAIGYSLASFQGHFSRVGIAIGGASLRTAQFGAGVLSALDSRNDTAKKMGTGGLLQVVSYLADSSGKCCVRMPSTYHRLTTAQAVLGWRARWLQTTGRVLHISYTAMARTCRDGWWTWT